MKKIILVLAIFTASVFCAEDLNATAKAGKKIYDTWCVTCHGAKMPGTNALAVLYKDSGIPAMIDERTDLNYDLVEFFVRNGKHSMPFFRKTEINDEELKALAEYLSRPRK